MSGRDSFDLKVLRGISCEFEYFGSEVFEDGGGVDGGGGTHALASGHLIIITIIFLLYNCIVIIIIIIKFSPFSSLFGESGQREIVIPLGSYGRLPWFALQSYFSRSPFLYLTFLKINVY